MGRNLLPVFGSNFVKCLTFHTSKLQLITLSRTGQSKDCTAASRTRFAHAPPRRHGLRSFPLCSSDSAQPREDIGLSPAEAVFDAQIVLPNKFLQNDEFSVDVIVKKISKTLHVSAPLPRHNSSTDLHRELLAELLSAPLVWGGLVPPLQLLYDGPYAVLHRGPHYFTIRVGSRDEVVAVSHLKACTAADATPGSPCCCSRPPCSHPGIPAATKWVLFSDPFLHLLFQRRHETVPQPFSYPARRFLHARDRRRHHRCHRGSTCPIYGHRHKVTQPRPELGGALWTPAYIPGDRPASWIYSTNCVQYLYISCYLSDNKPVLSYLLLRLLPQALLYFR